MEDFKENIFSDLHTYFHVSPIIAAFFTIPYPIPLMAS